MLTSSFSSWASCTSSAGHPKVVGIAKANPEAAGALVRFGAGLLNGDLSPLSGVAGDSAVPHCPRTFKTSRRSGHDLHTRWQLVPMRDASKHLPSAGTGRNSTQRLLSLDHRGNRGVLLESVRIGGTTYTSLEALQRFACRFERRAGRRLRRWSNSLGRPRRPMTATQELRRRLGMTPSTGSRTDRGASARIAKEGALPDPRHDLRCLFAVELGIDLRDERRTVAGIARAASSPNSLRMKVAAL